MNDVDTAGVFGRPVVGQLACANGRVVIHHNNPHGHGQIQQLLELIGLIIGLIISGQYDEGVVGIGHGLFVIGHWSLAHKCHDFICSLLIGSLIVAPLFDILHVWWLPNGVVLL
jgi:hypothetical protein